jgi:hydrogenase expression/formation protein HypE
MNRPREIAPQCPLPLQDYPQVLLAHGGGGTLMRQLIEQVFAAAFGGDGAGSTVDVEHDAVRLDLATAGPLVMTTDSYVVRPLFFPGGDIGTLAVHGTVNDLAMGGARPRFLSAGFILEEGLAMTDLWRVVTSMQRTAGEVGVRIVTGDTKVVERGKGDGVYINTAGVGEPLGATAPSPHRLRAGDAILLSGDLGRHGAAIMMTREQLGFSGGLTSDVGDLSALVAALYAAGVEPRCLRDLTRGGLASALAEIAGAARLDLSVDEPEVPVRSEVRAFCEVLGLDPLHVANEGRMVVVVGREDAQAALDVLRGYPSGMGAGAVRIGQVAGGERGRVLLRSALGAERMLLPLSGEQLPRIC